MAGLGFGGSACSLFDSDFTGTVNLDFIVDDADATYQSNDLFDPNENEDFANNRDRIKDGTIESMEFRFLDIRADNASEIVFGQVDLRPANSSDAWVEGVSAWSSIPVLNDNVFVVQVPAVNQEILSDLVFRGDDASALELRIDGNADQGPVKFNIRATLNMVFTAGL